MVGSIEPFGLTLLIAAGVVTVALQRRPMSARTARGSDTEEIVRLAADMFAGFGHNGPSADWHEAAREAVLRRLRPHRPRVSGPGCLDIAPKTDSRLAVNAAASRATDLVNLELRPSKAAR